MKLTHYYYNNDTDKLTKKFSKTKFGYYIVARLDGPGTTTIKSMIDNTGYPATQSYKRFADGRMKLLTITPYFDQMTIDEINKRGNIAITSPNPVPNDVWNKATQTTKLVDNTDSTITTSFDKVAKDAMFCFLNDVAWDSFFQWPQGNSYYAGGDFVQEYPFISRGATFLPGSIMMIYRSNPAASDSHGSTGGLLKMNINTKAKTSYAKLDASDMKFRHMTCVEYDQVNNQIWGGTGRNVFDVGTVFDSHSKDAVHQATMLNDGTGIAIYDTSGSILQYINANDPGSPLKNNRVVKLVYDKNSKYMWVAHYKGIQYYDCQGKKWYDIPKLQCNYAAASGIYLDPFDSDKVYFSFYSGTDTNTKKVSSQIASADTSIFEYSKSAKTVTRYVIDASANKGVSPQMGKTSANTLWVSKGNVLYRYNLSAKRVVEKIDMSTVIPEKVTPPANSTKVTLDFIHSVIAAPDAQTVIATVGCNIQYSTNLIVGIPSTYQKKNYVVRVTESAIPPSVVNTVNISEMNAVDGAGAIWGNSTSSFYVKDLVADPSSNGKTLYMALSNPPRILCSTDGAGTIWSSFSTDYSFNQVKGIALDGKGFLYAANGYFVGQNIAADFQAFGLCAHGGGMVHDDMNYDCTTGYNYSYPGPYAATGSSWSNTNGIRGASQMEPMMFLLLDGFYMGEARLAEHKCYPTTGGGGHIGHMTVFEPKCAPFAPRVNEDAFRPDIVDKKKIVIPLFSPGLPASMDGFIASTINNDTVQVFDNNSLPVPAVISYNVTDHTIVITGDFSASPVYSVKLSCGINGIKNLKGASLTNTRSDEFSDDITYRFGDNVSFDDNKITLTPYVPPAMVTTPVSMPDSTSQCDLTVPRVWLGSVPAVSTPLTVNFQIKNIGTKGTQAGAAAQKANVYYNDLLAGWVFYDDIAAKNTITLSAIIPRQFVTAGVNTTIRVVADATDAVKEIRESNNTNTVNFIIDTRPDLLVKEITLSSLKAGKTTVNFKIVNNGFGPTAAGAGAQTAAVYVNNSPVGTVNYDDLAKGAVVSLQLANVNVAAGLCKVKVVADSTGKVTEVSETNNTLEKIFTITK